MAKIKNPIFTVFDVSEGLVTLPNVMTYSIERSFIIIRESYYLMPKLNSVQIGRYR